MGAPLAIDMKRLALAAGLTAVVAIGPALADAELGGAGVDRPLPLGRSSVCELIERAAVKHKLPVEFFTRLIWRESGFRRNAVSPKGAQGIAQFMPGTASDRGLADPFDPFQAIPASAALLRALADQLGNLGLAAAAYNAGADRVSRWISGDGVLPAETEAYVLAITGRPAGSWIKAGDETAKEARCLDIVGTTKALAVVEGSPPSAPPARAAPWGVQVAGNFSRDVALRTYALLQRRFPAILGGKQPMVRSALMRSFGTRPMFQVRIPAETREGANDICQRLVSAGGACVVLKN